MDDCDWEDIVRESGEADPSDDISFVDAQPEELSVQPETIPLPQTPLEPVEQGNKHELDDHQVHSAETDAKTEDKPEADTTATEEEVCRICFSGAEEEPDLGVSPCSTLPCMHLCRADTVHVDPIEASDQPVLMPRVNVESSCEYVYSFDMVFMLMYQALVFRIQLRSPA